jgi:hypothetical protein
MAKRTIENCSMIKNAIKSGMGHCGTENGKCLGYANSGEEPHETCQECKLHVYYNESHDTEMEDEYMRSGY